MKIIASDFDGTLCRDGIISERDRAAIRAWREQGNLFGLVTGRDYVGSFGLPEEKGIELDFVIGCSGACAVGRDQRLLYEHIAQPDCLPELCALILENSPLYLYRCLGRDMLGVTVGWNADRKPGEVIDHGRVMCTLHDFVRGGGFHIMHTCYADGETAQRVAREINSRFGDYVTAHLNGYSIDTVGAGVSKTSGILDLAAHLRGQGIRIRPEQIITVGDNYNDLGMIRDFGGCAVANAVPEVKRAASAVYEDIAELMRRHSVS